MKKVAVLAVALALTACGGGGGSSPDPAGPASPGAGTGSGTGTGTGTGIGGPVVACAGSPVVASSTRYLGVMPSGQVGEFRFDTAARTSSYTVNGIRVDAALTRDDATCTYTGAATGSLPTAFVDSGLAVSAAAVGGSAVPALLVANPEASLAAVAGTYNVLRYERDLQGGESIRSSYATLRVEVSGLWRMCPAMAFSSACQGPSGSLAANASGGFDVVVGGATLGRLLPKVTSGAMVFAAAIADTSDPAGAVTGMWIGASNEAFAAGTRDGVYVTSTTDRTSSLLTLSGLTAQPQQRPTAVPILANNPVQGVFAIVTGDPTNDVGLATDSGLYADVAQANDKASAFMRFGVKQVR